MLCQVFTEKLLLKEHTYFSESFNKDVINNYVNQDYNCHGQRDIEQKNVTLDKQSKP